jgi:hypothetical protein
MPAALGYRLLPAIGARWRHPVVSRASRFNSGSRREGTRMTPAEHSAKYYATHKDKVNARARRRRKLNRVRTLVLDCRKADRRKGRENDLSEEFVEESLSRGCAYCGEADLLMTLDRMDNAIGHTTVNVVAACERCNFVRRDMPYEAWLVVAPAMRRAREAGLFGTWTCGIHGRTKLEPAPPRDPRQSPLCGTNAGYKKCGPPKCADCLRAHAKWKKNRRRVLRRRREKTLSLFD